MPDRGTWIRTGAGDLDPLWLLLVAHCGLGYVLTIVGAVAGGKAFGIAVANNVVSVLILAVIKVPIDRARLLAPALTKSVGALSAAVSPPYPGMDVNERDDG